MNIRKAEEKDIPRLLALLGQVLQIHAEIDRKSTRLNSSHSL